MLPDYVREGLRVVFCGTAVSTASAAASGYYAGPGNEFWGTLYESGLLPEPLGPHLSHRVLEFGIGLTDLAKGVAASSDRNLAGEYDVDGFVAKMERFQPEWVAFHGKTAGRVVSKRLGEGAAIALGAQSWLVARSSVFVCPSMSAANRDPTRLEGKPSREAWFVELARHIGR